MVEAKIGISSRELIGPNDLLVVKIGGSIEEEYLDTICNDIAGHYFDGRPIVILHGGSRPTAVLAEQIGHPQETVTTVSGHTSRRTDPETLKIFTQACAGLNRTIVAKLQERGVSGAFGISGIDGRLFEGRKKELRILQGDKKIILKDDYTGRAERMNDSLLSGLMGLELLPVICPPIISSENKMLNADFDLAAGLLAAELQAEALVILSNVPGLLRSYPDEASLIETMTAADLERLIASNEYGNFRKKFMAAKQAIEGGVGNVILADGRIDKPITSALCGSGTVISGSLDY